MPTWYETVLGFLLPSSCLSCQALITTPGCCLTCSALLPWVGAHCSCCAKALAVSDRCGVCRFKSPNFHCTIAPFQYAAPVNAWVTGLKFHEQLSYARFLAKCLWQACVEYYQQQPWPELIIPVPLHSSRLRERGFNQACLLAAAIAKRTDIPLARNVVVKIRSTVPQTALSKAARQRNNKRAFEINGVIKADHVALVDDVFTTGATVNEIARVLVKHGVAQVDVWCVARA